jgi:hypothetical protein
VTEEQWLTSTDPTAMLAFLRTHSRPSDRKLRLFAVACCRRVECLLSDERSRRALDVAEQFADGWVSHAERSNAFTDAFRTVFSVRDARAEAAYPRASTLRSNQDYDAASVYADDPDVAYAYSFAMADAASASRALAATAVADAVAVWDPEDREAPDRAPYASRQAIAATAYANDECDGEARRKEFAEQALLLHDIFQKPFEVAPAFNSSWRTPQVTAIAQHMYDSRDFTRMPSLADALEAAGCRDPEILAHCRSGNEHVRGCWLVDLVLSKQ